MPPIIPPNSKNLGKVSAIHKGAIAPENTILLWFDTTINKHKFYDFLLEAWIEIGGGSGFTPTEESAIVFVDSSGDLTTDVDNFNFTADGLFIKGQASQNYLNIQRDDASTALLLDEDTLYLPNTKLEGGEFYATHKPQLNLSADNGFPAIQYEFNASAQRFLVGATSVFGTNDVFFQGIPQSTSGYVALEAYGAAGLIIGTGGNSNSIQFRINRQLRGTFSNTELSVTAGLLQTTGISDSTGNNFKARNLSDTSNLVLSNLGVLTHQFTNTNYSAIGTGYAVELKRASGRALRFGTNATHSLIQSTDGSGNVSPLWINGFSSNHSIEVGVNSTTFSGINAGQTIVSVVRYGSGVVIGSGGSGNGFVSGTQGLTLGSGDNSYISIGTDTLLRTYITNISQTFSAIGTGYGLSVGSMRSQIRFGDSIGGGFGKVAYLMQVVSNNLTDASDLKINPFGGNVGIGVAETYTIPVDARLHVRGDSDSVGNVFQVNSLSNNLLTITNNGDTTMYIRSGRSFISVAEDSTALFKILRGNTSGDGMLFFVSSSTLIMQHNTNTAVSNIVLIQGDHIDANITIGRIGKGTIGIQHRNITPSLANWGAIIGVDAASGGYGISMTGGYSYNVIQGQYGALSTRMIALQPFGNSVNIGHVNAPTALLDIAANTTAYAQLKFRDGVAPTTPTNGDMWSNGSDLFVHFGGVTYTLVKV